MNGRPGIIGVLGGMGPAATVDFMGKLVGLSPASCDQEHLPVLVANLPHVPDRSRAILGNGADPLPYMLRGIDMLNQAQVGLVVVPCNTSHHWYDEMSRACRAPILHIARACVAALPAGEVTKVMLLATRGAIQSGFYQRELAARGLDCMAPEAGSAQEAVDACIRAVKGGDLAAGSQHLALALADARARGAQAVIMGCTEIPVAAAPLQGQGLLLVDSSLELARQAVRHAHYLGWNRAPWLGREGAAPDAPAAAAQAPSLAAPATAAATVAAVPAAHAGLTHWSEVAAIQPPHPAICVAATT
jgi:aspartate racemase